MTVQQISLLYFRHFSIANSYSLFYDFENILIVLLNITERDSSLCVQIFYFVKYIDEFFILRSYNTLSSVLNISFISLFV